MTFIDSVCELLSHQSLVAHWPGLTRLSVCAKDVETLSDSALPKVCTIVKNRLCQCEWSDLSLCELFAS